MFLRSPYGNVENGVYVLRQESSSGDNTFIKCLAADGRWNWTVNQRVPNPWGSIPPLLPVFKRLGVDRVNGYHDLQFIPWYWNGTYQGTQAIHFTENESGQPVLDVRYSGDGKDAFRMDYNQLFSPYSNPNSQRLNKTTTLLALILMDSTQVSHHWIYMLVLHFWSTIQTTKLKKHSTNNSLLTWEVNIEPDKSYYNLYKYVTAEIGWQMIGIASTPIMKI
jgi:hypothetical protein